MSAEKDLVSQNIDDPAIETREWALNGYPRLRFCFLGIYVNPFLQEKKKASTYKIWWT